MRDIPIFLTRYRSIYYLLTALGFFFFYSLCLGQASARESRESLTVTISTRGEEVKVCLSSAINRRPVKSRGEARAPFRVTRTPPSDFSVASIFPADGSVGGQRKGGRTKRGRERGKGENGNPSFSSVVPAVKNDGEL